MMFHQLSTPWVHVLANENMEEWHKSRSASIWGSVTSKTLNHLDSLVFSKEKEVTPGSTSTKHCKALQTVLDNSTRHCVLMKNALQDYLSNCILCCQLPLVTYCPVALWIFKFYEAQGSIIRPSDVAANQR